MGTNFPTNLDSFGSVVNEVTYYDATHINDVRRAIEAIETKIGWDNSTVSSTLEYKINALQFMKGYAQRAQFSLSGSDILMNGAQYAISDRYVYWDSQLTLTPSVTGSQFYYIYIDYSSLSVGQSILLAGNFVTSITSPAWNSTYHGYYNGEDRCIFAFRVTSGVIVGFYHDGDFVQYSTMITDRTYGSGWTSGYVTLTIPDFSRKALVSVEYRGSSTASVWGAYVVYGDSSIPSIGILTTNTDSSKRIYVEASGFLGVFTSGFYLPDTV